MSLRECFERVFSEYLIASREPFAHHELANFIRREFRNQLAFSTEANDRLIFKGSAGQGTWARGPWIAIFDRLITNTAQQGYYPVYLFREDMSGAYLSLNQGITEVKKAYRSDAKTALRARSENFRAILGGELALFPMLEINLTPSTASSDTAFYEAGNICAKFYPAHNLPSEEELTIDLRTMLLLYESVVLREIRIEATTTQEGDEPKEMQYEDATRFRIHKRIERNSGLAKQVKKSLGYTCQVCNLNFETLYGAIGKNYIEAHHLTPLASLKGQKVAMNPEKDFAVLCANCHRMVHRAGCADNIEKFKAEHYLMHRSS